MDFETRSSAGFVWDSYSNKFIAPAGARNKGLQTVGVSVYSEHPSTDIICLAYNLKNGEGPKQWCPGNPPPLDLFRYLQSGGLIEAWNVAFEYYIWTNVASRRYMFPPLILNSLRCAMAKSKAHALPGSLDAAGQILGITNKKLKDGKRLIKRYCEPHKPTKNHLTHWHLVEEYPQDYALMLEYNLVDILAESEISSLIPDLSSSELEFWQIDQRINRRGVRLDRNAIEACLQIMSQAYREGIRRLATLTDNKVMSISQVQRIREWMMEHGVSTPSLDAENLQQILKSKIPDVVREVLELRQSLNSAAVKKLPPMINRMSKDGRVRDLFMYHAARTGRAGGDGIQPHNLPNNNGLMVYKCSSCDRYFDKKDCPWCGLPIELCEHVEWNSEAIENAFEVIATKSLTVMRFYFNDPVAAISGCLRGMFVPAQGHDFVCSDYSSIEGVVIAALAREQWHLDVYTTHGMMYEATASKVTGTPFDEFIRIRKETGKHHSERKLGKVAALASQYGGWIGAWIKFGADEFLTEEEMKKSILAWREANPFIVRFWRELEIASHMAVMHPNIEFQYHEICFTARNNVLYCRLPSGRFITYHSPEIAPNPDRPGTMQLSYMGWNTDPKKGRIGWTRLNTWGARLVENVVQAVARDILAHAIVNLEKQNYPVVLHIHDEIVCEIPENLGSVRELEHIMMQLPKWAEGWPIKARDGWRAKRYQK